MSLTWKDGLATVFVGVAAVLYLLWAGGTTVSGLSGPRALTVAIFGLGVGGATRPSHTWKPCTASGADPVRRSTTSYSPRSWVVSCSSRGSSRLPVAVTPHWRR